MTMNRSPSPADNNNQDDKTVECPLLDLQEDIRDTHLYPNFSLKEHGLFAQTSIDVEKATAFLRLLPAAVDAEPESYKQEEETKLAAIAILKRHPELLFRKGVVTDHFGRKILASPYQLFLGTGDKWALRQVHEQIMPNIKDAEAKAKADFKAQFPTCSWPPAPNMGEEALYDDRNKKQIEQVIAQLKTIVGKITADPCTNGLATLDGTKEAVAELCQLFAPEEGKIIKTGLHFPLAIMKQVYKVYDAQFNPWSGAQLAFFSREVIGAALAASTAVDGQCCKKGLNNLDMKKGPDRRDGLVCRHPKGIPPELAPISDKLGRTMFVDPYNGYSCFLTSNPSSFDWYKKNGAVGPGGFGGAVGAGGVTRRCSDALDQLIENKSRHIWELMQPHEEKSTRVTITNR